MSFHPRLCLHLGLVCATLALAACKTPSPAAKLNTSGSSGTKAPVETTAAPHFQVGVKLPKATLDFIRDSTPDQLVAAGLPKAGVALVKLMTPDEVKAKGWKPEEMAILGAVSDTDANNMGMNPVALAAMKQALLPPGSAMLQPSQAVAALLTAATPVAVKAADGGMVTSADGSVAVTIPPGALAKDASVRLVPTSHDGLGDKSLPGIQYALDLGGVALAPDQSLKITMAVSADAVAALKNKDKAFAPAKYSLSQDAKGGWLMTMSVQGPTSKPTAAPKTLPGLGPFYLAELGHLPLPRPADFQPPGLVATFAALGAGAVAPGAPAKPFVLLQDAGLPGETPVQTQFRLDEAAGVFSCYTLDNSCDGNAQISALGFAGHTPADLVQFGILCGSFAPGGTPASTAPTSPDPSTPDAPPTQAPEPAPIPIVSVPVIATFSSDDAKVNGQPAAGATITFSGLQWGDVGPGQVVAAADGTAATYGPAGTYVTATASIDLGPISGAPVGASVTPGMAALQVSVQKNSPNIAVNFTCADAPLGSKLTLSYTLDGVPKTAEFTVSDPTAPNYLDAFKVDLPDDEAHAIKLKGITGQNLGFLNAVPADLQVRRNGYYTERVTLFNNLPK